MKSKKILALDLGVNTGWTHSNGPSGVWRFKINKDESAGMRLIRLEAKLQEMDESVGIDVVVFEACRAGFKTRMGALVVQAEFQGIVKHWCEENDVQYKGYSPTEIKLHATGNGKANKEMMLESAKEKWYQKEIEDDNEADALWLLDLAKKDLGI